VLRNGESQGVYKIFWVVVQDLRARPARKPLLAWLRTNLNSARKGNRYEFGSIARQMETNKRRAKERWGKLTDDDMNVINGRSTSRQNPGALRDCTRTSAKTGRHERRHCQGRQQGSRITVLVSMYLSRFLTGESERTTDVLE
jgi:hypothetical protein